jgi:hypothetical protein
MAKNVNSNVYDRTISLKRDGGTVQNLDSCSIPVKNVQPLENFVPKSSLRSHKEWDWKDGKGKEVVVHEDLLRHAQRSISRGKFETVTSGASQRREEALAAKAGQRDGLCAPVPCCDWNQPGSPVPLSAQSMKKRY